MGMQVCDQAGRVKVILPTPEGSVRDIAFGGESLDTAFVISGDKIYKRRLKVRGALSCELPIKPPAPHL